MRRRGAWALALVGAAAGATGGCAPKQAAAMSTEEMHAITMRSAATDRETTLRAVIDAMLDEGYVLRSVESSAGMAVGTKIETVSKQKQAGATAASVAATAAVTAATLAIAMAALVVTGTAAGAAPAAIVFNGRDNVLCTAIVDHAPVGAGAGGAVGRSTVRAVVVVAGQQGPHPALTERFWEALAARGCVLDPAPPPALEQGR